MSILSGLVKGCLNHDRSVAGLVVNKAGLCLKTKAKYASHQEAELTANRHSTPKHCTGGSQN